MCSSDLDPLRVAVVYRTHIAITAPPFCLQVKDSQEMSNVTSHNQEPAGFAELLRSPLMLAFGALCIAFAPVLYAYLTQLWTREYYQFFPVAFASTLFLASLRTSQEPDFSGNMLRQSVRVSAILIAVASTIFEIGRAHV